MKILLVGEYSNVHWTLAEGLRALGHTVVVASGGDYWKNYRRNVDLARNGKGSLAGAGYYLRMLRIFTHFKGFDVVQVINPIFLELKAERMLPFFRLLKKNNKKVFLCAMGMDYYYVKWCLEQHITDYSELMVDGKIREVTDNLNAIKEWTESYKRELNELMAKECDGVAAGLWEYYQSYCGEFGDKCQYIPLPVWLHPEARVRSVSDKVRFFIGVQKSRSAFKGTDILLPILHKLESEFPTRCQVIRIENLPFNEYSKIMGGSHVLIDQLYSPSPNMNSLLAMSQGLVVAGGGEELPYKLLGEEKLRPVINLPCDEPDIYTILREVILHPETVEQKSRESMEFVRRWHSPKRVAALYTEFWNR